ncbi:hypothetical protein PCE1_000322 [Barthelona sp. PCE]
MQLFLPLIQTNSLDRIRALLQNGCYKEAHDELSELFEINCSMLDNRRLGKQRVEAMQIINSHRTMKRLFQTWVQNNELDNIIQQCKVREPRNSSIHVNKSKIGDLTNNQWRGLPQRIKLDNSIGWAHHPMVLMTRNDATFVKIYYNACLNVWISRGKQNNMSYCVIDEEKISLPVWFGNLEFHRRHQLKLQEKDKFYNNVFDPIGEEEVPEYLWWDEDSELMYEKSITKIYLNPKKN